ncbi:hypothetical protein [Mycobacterium sp. E1747]|uniref:hypothetical protein n=1 Tax=Mycobacterium sp. E1747 TaxID=1834128 RepID=UPI0009EDCA29|nr:hypothetical protein [Mycobacterium sp. E1747]
MVGNQPWRPGEGTAAQPPLADWTPSFSGHAGSRSRPWLAVAVGLTAAVAVAALIVAATRSAPQPTNSTAAPIPSASETAAAQRQLCDTYKLAARAVEVDTGGNDRALARIATTNGAVMLENAIASPALDAKHRDAARALAGAYATLTAMSNNTVATDAQYQAALDDITAKDSVMKSVCANGGS